MPRKLWVSVGLIILVLGAIWWVMISMPGESHKGPLPPADDGLKTLADELRSDVRRLAVDFGERNVGNCPQELALTAAHIEAEFREVGYDVQRQEYGVSGVTCANVIAELRGVSRPAEIVVVGAHYDTAWGTPGANDNTSGVAATLALARRFAKGQTDRTLRFIAFVNEEPPYFQTDRMGSLVYARQCRRRKEDVVAMLSLETIGYYDDAPGSQKYPAPLGLLYPSEGNFIGIVSNIASRSLVHRVVGTFRKHEPFPCEGGAMPAALPGVGFSDHWSFWQQGYKAVMVTDTAMFRYPYYHDARDTIDKIDFDRMARVVRGLKAVVAELAGAGESRADAPQSGRLEP